MSAGTEQIQPGGAGIAVLRAPDQPFEDEKLGNLRTFHLLTMCPKLGAPNEAKLWEI
jgi:hypothetical protein